MRVDREEFIKALGHVKPALAKGDRVKIAALGHLWFDGKHVEAFDGGFGIKMKLKTELNCGVPGTTFLALLGTSALKEIEFEEKEVSLQVKIGKAASKVSTLAADSNVWPYPVKLPRHTKPLFLEAPFVEALRRVLLIKSSQAERVEHHGVMVTKSKNDLYLHTTDSATMAEVCLEGLGKEATFERVLLPRGFAEELVSQLPEGADFCVLSDCLLAEGDNVSLYSNLLDISTADDMAAVVARVEGKHPTLVPLPAGLDGALARAEILAGQEEPVVTLVAEGTTLTVQGDYTLGAVDEPLTLEGKLPNAKISIRAKHLRRALAHTEEISVAKDSLLLRGDGNFTYVVAAYTG